MDASSKKKRTRGKLSREMIEDAAFEVIEREGLSGFSMRKLAARLGCEAMSIYHHFPSQAHLYEALVDRQMSGLVIPDDSLPWRERARIGMQEFRRVATEHPAFAPFIVVYRMNSPPCLAKLNAIIGLFEDGGFGPELSARLFRAAGYYLMGAILDETNGYARGPSAVTPVPGEVIMRDFPSVAAVAPWFQTPEHKANFDYGLTLMLDAFDAELAKATGAKPDGS